MHHTAFSWQILRTIPIGTSQSALGTPSRPKQTAPPKGLKMCSPQNCLSPAFGLHSRRPDFVNAVGDQRLCLGSFGRRAPARHSLAAWSAAATRAGLLLHFQGGVPDNATQRAQHPHQLLGRHSLVKQYKAARQNNHCLQMAHLQQHNHCSRERPIHR